MSAPKEPDRSLPVHFGFVQVFTVDHIANGQKVREIIHGLDSLGCVWKYDEKDDVWEPLGVEAKQGQLVFRQRVTVADPT